MPSTNQIALSTQGIRFRRGRRYILDRINLDVYSGELFSLLGESGSGKTTFLKILAGLLEPEEGTVTIDGHNQTDPVVPPHKRNIGFVFQGAGALFPHLSVFENVYYPFRLGRRRPTHVDPKMRVNEILKQLGIASSASKRISELSGGEKQRVALARAMVYRPRLLLLDEPTTGLDNRNKRAFIEALHESHQTENFTCILVTHDEREACSVSRSSRVAVLSREGSILQVDSPETIRNDPETAEVAEIMRGWVLIGVKVEGGTIKLPDGQVLLQAAQVPSKRTTPPPDTNYLLGFPGFAVSLQATANSIVLTGVVEGVEVQEFHHTISVTPPIATAKPMRILMTNGSSPAPNQAFSFHVDHAHLRLFDL